MGTLNEWLRKALACPRDRDPLESRGDRLVCPCGHEYPVVDGIPVLLRDDIEQTLWVADDSIKEAKAHRCAPSGEGPSSPVYEGVDPFVQAVVASTCGHLYEPLVNRLSSYPIPDIRLPDADGPRFLDVGCNWGRWCVAAARRGYRPVGIDPSLAAVMAARNVTRQLGVPAVFVVGDARYLPFATECFDVVFSYSVLQHLSRPNVCLALDQVRCVLKPGGRSLIQMPNRYGLRCLYHQVRRGFRDGSGFEVRYWRPEELVRTFSERIGPSTLSVDGFFGLGIQKADIGLLPRRYRAVVRASEWLRKLSERAKWLACWADSVYLESVRG